jgi:hypothetical protein
MVPVAVIAGAGGFDGLYGQDPFGYYNYAVGPLQESLRAGQAWPPFYWPPGYPLLTAAATALVGVRPLAGQWVAWVMGGLVPVGTFALARELTRDRDSLAKRESDAVGRGPRGKAARLGKWVRSYGVPLAAGLLAALCGQLWQSSAVVMADTTGLAAATLGMWAAARYGRDGAGGGWLVVASAAFGAAILARWIYALAAVPCMVYVLVVIGQRARRGAGGLLVWPVAAGLAGLVMLWPVTGPVLDVALGRTDGLASFAGNLQGRGWAPANALRREFDTADGRLSYSLPNGLYYALAPAHRYYFTAILAPFIAVGLWQAARRRSLALGLLAAGWAAVVLAYHAGDPWQNFRFTLAYLPPLAILAALGVEAAGEWAGGHWRWGKAAVLGWFVVGLGVMAAGGVALTQSFVTRKAAQLDVVRAVEAAVPADSRLVAFGLTLTFQHYSALETEELYYLGVADLERMAAETGRPLYLLANAAELEGQWHDMPMGASYRWLREGPGLAVVGEWEGYTLWAVGR